jgi:hypothetical protein
MLIGSHSTRTIGNVRTDVKILTRTPDGVQETTLALLCSGARLGQIVWRDHDGDTLQGPPPYRVADGGPINRPHPAPVPVTAAQLPYPHFPFNWDHNIVITIDRPNCRFAYQPRPRDGRAVPSVHFLTLRLITQVQSSLLVLDIQ